MMATEQRRALRAGTQIEYCEMPATVLKDTGGERIEVACEGHRQDWYWTFEGVSCVVVELAPSVETTTTA